MRDIHKYDDIINLPHHTSKNHPKMSVLDRAVQFGAFDPLSGYKEAIAETARLTENKAVISASVAEILNKRLLFLKENIEKKPQICVTYFTPDHKKEGGGYVTKAANLRKIDEFNKIIVLDGDIKIPISNILKINSDLFEEVM